MWVVGPGKDEYGEQRGSYEGKIHVTVMIHPVVHVSKPTDCTTVNWDVTYGSDAYYT